MRAWSQVHSELQIARLQLRRREPLAPPPQHQKGQRRQSIAGKMEHHDTYWKRSIKLAFERHEGG